MALRTTAEGAAESRAFWERQTAKFGTDADLALFGTVTDEPPVVRLRDALERAHAARLLRVAPGARVLDLAAGAGRFALELAPRVGHVTLVDISPSLLEVARARAQRLGLTNLSFVESAIQDFVPEGQFDVILIMGVLTYLTDEQVEEVARRCAMALAPGGQLLLKEPVSTTGETLHDHGQDESDYHARFRPREAYARTFGRHLRPSYQSATCAHLVPRFLGGTQNAAKQVGSGAAGRALSLLTPLLVRMDPSLLALELGMRRDPRLRRLLAPVDVLQDIYVFEAQGTAELADRPPEQLLSVVVIAYNEQDCIQPVTLELLESLQGGGVPHEILLVDDGSSDGTADRMHELAASHPQLRVIQNPRNLGIGGALRAGFDAARGSHVTWAPADGQIDPGSLVELYRRRREAPMLTTVYRERNDAWYRHAISSSLNTLIKLRTGQVAKSGGNYLFERSAWERFAPEADDSMMISTAFRHRLRDNGQAIVEVEIDARARVAGHSKVLNPRTLWRTLTALGRIPGPR